MGGSSFGDDFRRDAVAQITSGATRSGRCRGGSGSVRIQALLTAS